MTTGLSAQWSAWVGTSLQASRVQGGLAFRSGGALVGFLGYLNLSAAFSPRSGTVDVRTGDLGVLRVAFEDSCVEHVDRDGFEWSCSAWAMVRQSLVIGDTVIGTGEVASVGGFTVLNHAVAERAWDYEMLPCADAIPAVFDIEVVAARSDDCAEAVALSERVDTLFTNSCGSSACHEGSDPAPPLLVGDFDLYASMVDVPSEICPEFRLIDSADPEESFLFLKLRGTQGVGCGERMPQISVMSDEEIALVRDWIVARGACSDL